MDYFSPGLRESGRQLRRQLLRWQLWRRGRLLAKAETDLGLLGWQQADFDEETQRQVDAIQDVEREQSRLINAAAERGASYRRLKAEYEAAQRACQEKRSELLAEEKRIREPRLGLEERLAERRKTEPNFERRMPELDRELREVTKLLSELLNAEPQTPRIRQEIIRMRERSVAIPNEKNDLRTGHLRTVTEVRSLEDALAKNLQAAADVNERIGRLDSAWAEQEREFQEKMREEEREKAKIEKQSTLLEGAKENPYQAIGRVLAQTNLAPMNQPQALETVKQLEYAIGAIRQSILESGAASAEEDPAPLRISYIVWGLILFLLCVVLYAALS